MPYKDERRVIGFYSKVFGWDMNSLGSQMNNYILAGTTETENMIPKKPGAINGGLFPIEETNKYPSLTIQVENIEQAIKEVVDAGGKVLGEPVDIMGVGKYFAIYDTEGNRASVLQPLP